MLLDCQSYLDNNYLSLKTRLGQITFFGSIFLVMLFHSTLANADEVFDFQMQLAKIGNPIAQLKVGEMYESGSGVKKDLKKAKTWIKKAAEKGNEVANFKLLYWDIEKQGLKGANKQKFAQLRVKAEDENAQAMYYLGKMYAHGVGVKKNYDKSLNWLNKATYAGVSGAEKEAALVRGVKQKVQVKNRTVEEQRKAEDLAKREAAIEAKAAAEAETGAYE